MSLIGVPTLTLLLLYIVYRNRGRKVEQILAISIYITGLLWDIGIIEPIFHGIATAINFIAQILAVIL